LLTARIGAVRLEHREVGVAHEKAAVRLPRRPARTTRHTTLRCRWRAATATNKVEAIRAFVPESAALIPRKGQAAGCWLQAEPCHPHGALTRAAERYVSPVGGGHEFQWKRFVAGLDGSRARTGGFGRAVLGAKHGPHTALLTPQLPSAR